MAVTVRTDRAPNQQAAGGLSQITRPLTFPVRFTSPPREDFGLYDTFDQLTPSGILVNMTVPFRSTYL